MSECTETDKPLISILMAVYEPRMDWLREQLLSLNAQTYPNLRLYVCDDCSPTVPYEAIRLCVKACITAFPFEICRNEKNLGSNGTFERLTREADGDYFAYCDQDDVWLPEKLETLAATMEKEQALLVCSDMYVIDGDGQRTADSITKVRRHHVFRSGDDLAEGLLFHNFVTGCTMLVNAEQAKAAVPFCPYMVHDQFIALACAEHGKIVSILKPQIYYRIHGGNQTGLMAGVSDKASYRSIRIDEPLQKMLWLQENYPAKESLKKVIDDGVVWMTARQKNWDHQGHVREVWKYRKFSPLTSVAEICLKNCSDRLFLMAISLARKNRI